ncbi:TolB family protein [Sphingobacterium sp. SYP-B4668]|uniref:TolB family protein n=1 Tax=Sphingobacterium sp. SYP-B4668 TaxID=2996035 RepID=UPI0022DDF148|nr:hypothetical protein [Sphingobacterium sp. SYP-B4668]
MKNKLIITLSLGLLPLFGCSDNNVVEIEKAELPTHLKGQLLYHTYTNYGANDSEIFLYDFSSNKVQSLSSGWDIKNPMNAHISPDGTRIVFMGISEDTDSWDIFVYELNSSKPPENLTLIGQTRDEDPKFAPDGKRVVFKQDSRIVEMDLASRKVTRLSPKGYGIPYYNHDGTKVVCTQGDAATSSIAIIDVKSKEIQQTVYDAEGVQDYYPINADQTSFYYSVGLSKTNTVDQVYRGYWSGLRSYKLPFNANDGNYSDAYPIDENWLVLCSTRPDTKGGYDLYVANVHTGDIYSMDLYNTGINSPKQQLGPCYFTKK